MKYAMIFISILFFSNLASADAFQTKRIRECIGRETLNSVLVGTTSGAVVTLAVASGVAVATTLPVSLPVFIGGSTLAGGLAGLSGSVGSLAYAEEKAKISLAEISCHVAEGKRKLSTKSNKLKEQVFSFQI